MSIYEETNIYYNTLFFTSEIFDYTNIQYARTEHIYRIIYNDIHISVSPFLLPGIPIPYVYPFPFLRP